MKNMPVVVSAFLLGSYVFAAVDCLSHQYGNGELITEGYGFDKFVSDFGRTYKAGSDEFSSRASIFHDSLSLIREKNSHARRSWTAGVNSFMDWTESERARLHGYRPSTFRQVTEVVPLVALQTKVAAISVKVYGGIEDSFEAAAPAVRDQGFCGSCWAVAAAEAVEARLMKSSSSSGQVSVQALLDCVPNPKHCGGSGGCGGGTPGQAFDFMRNHGVPLEEDLPYNPKHTGKCPLDPYPSNWARVTLTGWQSLPQNQAQPLMQCIVNDGPVVVTVAAGDWFPYSFGVFDGCSKDTIPNHSVLARGYGTEGDKKYWSLQNSWGTRWGEHGSIRLLRHDDEDGWCGVDSRPQEGFACEDDATQNITVCGNCGILSDPVVPQVGGVTFDQFGYGSGSASSGATVANSQSDAPPEVSQIDAVAGGDWRMPTVVQPDSDGFTNSASMTSTTPTSGEESERPQFEKNVGLGEGLYLPGKTPMDSYLRR